MLDIISIKQLLSLLLVNDSNNMHSCVCSVVPDSLCPHGLHPTRLLISWNFLGRTVKWVSVFSSKGSSRPRIEPVSPMSPALAGRFFTTELPGKLSNNVDKMIYVVFKVALFRVLTSLVNIHAHIG